MKKFLTLIILLAITYSCYTQSAQEKRELYKQSIHELRDQQIFEESEIIDTYFKGTEVERLMKSGSRNLDLSVITMTSGGILAIGSLILGSVEIGGSPVGIDGKYPLVGLGLLSAGIFFRVLGKNKIAKARYKMSKSGIHYIGGRTQEIPELHLGMTADGIGLVISF